MKTLSKGKKDDLIRALIVKLNAQAESEMDENLGDYIMDVQSDVVDMAEDMLKKLGFDPANNSDDSELRDELTGSVVYIPGHWEVNE